MKLHTTTVSIIERSLYILLIFSVLVATMLLVVLQWGETLVWYAAAGGVMSGVVIVLRRSR